MRDTRADSLRLDDAVNRADIAEVRALLDDGVDPSIRDVAGDPILVGAAWVGAPEIVQLLLERGAEVNARGADGQNALQRVLGNDSYWHEGHDQVVLLLRGAGSEE